MTNRNSNTTLRLLRLLSPWVVVACAPVGESGVVCDVPLEECSHGLFHGDCGGIAGPVFACGESGGCRWYTGGCPEGVIPSDCEAEDICCHMSADGPWPFEDWSPRSDMGTVEMTLDIAAMGWKVVDGRAPAEIAVTIDPAIGAPDSSEVVCTPGAPLQLCEDGTLMRISRQITDESLVLRFESRGTFGEWFILEIIPGEGTPLARVFVRDFTDAARPSTPRACLPFHMETRAGTLRMNTIDLSMRDLVHGVLDLELVDGHTMIVSF